MNNEKRIRIQNGEIWMQMRNFSGAQKRYNDAGKRNFLLFIDKDTADLLYQIGVSVKQTNATDEFDARPFIKVPIKYYEDRPDRNPKIFKRDSHGVKPVKERNVGSLDYEEIEGVDLVLRVYYQKDKYDPSVGNWRIALQSMVVDISEDPLLAEIGGYDDFDDVYDDED